MESRNSGQLPVVSGQLRDDSIEPESSLTDNRKLKGFFEKKPALITDAYTFYLEEFDVEPGDIISYYAHATDNNTRTGPGEGQ